MYHYETSGTCSTAIELEIENGIITDCRIVEGCQGNTQGLCRMVIGCDALQVQKKLEGIQCRNGTSCPDQLSKAIAACLAEAAQ